MLEYFISYHEGGELSPYCRCRVDILSEAEAGFVKLCIDVFIHDNPNFYFQDGDELGIRTPKGKLEHLPAMKKFDEKNRKLLDHLKEYHGPLQRYFRNQASDVSLPENKDLDAPITAPVINKLLAYIYTNRGINFYLDSRMNLNPTPFERIDDMKKFITDDGSMFYAFYRLRHFPEPLKQILTQLMNSLVPFTHIITMYDLMRDVRDSLQYFRDPEYIVPAQTQHQKATPQSLETENITEHPYQIQAASGRDVHSVIVGDNHEEIGNTVGNPLNVKDEQLAKVVSLLEDIYDKMPTGETVEKQTKELTAVSREPQAVFLVNPPKNTTYEPANVNVNVTNTKDIHAPVVKAVDKNTKAVEKQGETLNTMAAEIGKSVAKWLTKLKLAKTRRLLLEEVLSDMGFAPMEVVEELYPNANPTERREKSVKISNDHNKRKKQSSKKTYKKSGKKSSRGGA